MIEKLGGDIDASIGNAVVEGRRCGEALQAEFPRFARNHPMQGDAGVVINPEDFIAAQIVSKCGHEATGRRCAFLGENLRYLPVTNAGHSNISSCQTEECRSSAEQPTARIKDKNFGLYLVDDNKGHAAIVTRIDNPVSHVSRLNRHTFLLEVSPFPGFCLNRLRSR